MPAAQTPMIGRPSAKSLGSSFSGLSGDQFGLLASLFLPQGSLVYIEGRGCRNGFDFT